MTLKEAKKRIKELRETIAYHAKKYYDEDNPEIKKYRKSISRANYK